MFYVPSNSYDHDGILPPFYGDCVEVHITNLAEPACERLVRPVDPDHVQYLTDEMRKSAELFIVLAGMVDEEVDLDQLKEPNCGTDVEVLGGNHTRIALQYLHSSNHLHKETVKVRVYKDLTDAEALSIGYLHNKQAEKSKKMTFMDETRLVKDKLQSCPPESILREKKKLVQIFNLKNVTALNYNYKAHLALAMKASDAVWDLAVQLEKLWVEGKIKGVKKGREMKQTIFHDIFSHNLSEENRQDLLKLIIANGKKAFSQRLRELVKKNDEDDNEEMDQSENREVHAEEQATEGHEAMSEAEQTTDDRDEIIRKLKEENEKLKMENESLKQVVAELKSSQCIPNEIEPQATSTPHSRRQDKRSTVCTEEIEPQATSTPHSRCQDKGSTVCTEEIEPQTTSTPQTRRQDKRSTVCTEDKENKTPSRKRRAVSELQVGDLVNATWSVDKQKYKARIIKKLSDELYKVIFIQDDVEEDVQVTEIKKRRT